MGPEIFKQVYQRLVVRLYCRGTATVVRESFECAEDPVLDVFGIGEAGLLEAAFDFGDFFDLFGIVRRRHGGWGIMFDGEVAGFIGWIESERVIRVYWRGIQEDCIPRAGWRTKDPSHARIRNKRN